MEYHEYKQNQLKYFFTKATYVWIVKA